MNLVPSLPALLVVLLVAAPVAALAPAPAVPSDALQLAEPVDLRGCSTPEFGFVAPTVENTALGDDCAFRFHLTAIGAYEFVCIGPGECLAWFQQGWSTYAILCEGTGSYGEVRLATGDVHLQRTDNCDFWWGHSIHPIDMTTWYAYVAVDGEGDTTGAITVCATGPAALPCLAA